MIANEKEYLIVKEKLQTLLLDLERMEKKKVAADDLLHFIRMDAVRAEIEELKIEIKQYYLSNAKQHAAMEDFDATLEDYKKILEMDEGSSPIILNLIGRLFLAKRDYPKAVEYFSINLPEGYTGLGDAYAGMKDYKAAIFNYTSAIATDPGNYSAYNNRADTYKAMGKYEDALNDIFEAIELNPDKAIAYLTLAEIYAHSEKLNEFYLTFEHALKLDKEVVDGIIRSESYYQQFFKEERFTALLEKYNVDAVNNS
ncbi:tetratricopeptide repeat protein [Chitinophaga sp. MM2321]|uniref:tetratricopeptide repeat protein n=1 Tax=Chitinophaga sp. MM2321 TaxID=3137178 RepID=UPI0032D573EF